MREIKYRMWNKKEKKMYEVGVLDFDDKKAYIKDYLNYTISNYMFEDIELMQYAGLKDKNGKEIYEGDIVKFKHGAITIMASVKYGEWQESKCDEYDCSHYGYYIDYKWDNYCENTGFDLYEKIVEVLGNIYENPDLLKGEQS